MRWRGMDEAAPEQYTTLREALEERRALMERYVPAATQALHRGVVEKLQATTMAPLPVGAQAPEFELPDQEGRILALRRPGAGGAAAALTADGPAVLLFFRGRWCPFCVAQLEAWDRLMPSMAHAGMALAAISPQTQHQGSLMHDQHHLRYPLLRDAGNRVARQFGIVYAVPEEQRRVYRRTFVNLPFVNGDETWELPIPATFVVDRDGSVMYAAADADYTRRPEPLDVLAAVERKQGGDRQ